MLVRLGLRAALTLALGCQGTQPARAESADVPKVTAQALVSDYIIGPGDSVHIEDANMGDLGGATARILAGGMVDLPLVGEVNLAGYTLTDAEAMLNRLYGEYYVNPRVSIEVTYQHPVRVYVEGAVSNPGVYVSGKSIPPGRTTMQSLGTANTLQPYYRLYLTDALMMAGGLKYDANIGDVRIHRRYPQPTTIHVNLWELVKNGSIGHDLPLREHDVIEVAGLPAEAVTMNPDRSLLARSNLSAVQYEVNVLGAVEKPGTYELGLNDNLLTAISRAGGMGELAQRKKVYILRANSTGQVFKREIDLSDPENIKKAEQNGELARLMPDDVIFVDESGGRKARQMGGNFLMKMSGAAMLPFFNQLVNF